MGITVDHRTIDDSSPSAPHFACIHRQASAGIVVKGKNAARIIVRVRIRNAASSRAIETSARIRRAAQSLWRELRIRNLPAFFRPAVPGRMDG